jgi:hypothetical protein
VLPPTLRELVRDPIYRPYFTHRPKLYACQARVDARPWAVYGRLMVADEDAAPRWRAGTYRTYHDAFAVVKDALRNDQTYTDVALVSRSVLYHPPVGLVWTRWGARLEWCGRCRRPTYYRKRPNHHALRHAPVLTSDEAYRCYYCGMRRVAQPGYRVRRR